MNTKEELLVFIARIENEAEQAKTYGSDWVLREYIERRSHAAGKLCLTMGTLAKAEAKANRRPGSIGARKARQKAKAARRELKELTAVIAQSFKDYHPTAPEYITGPSEYITIRRPTVWKVQQWKRNSRPDFKAE